LNDLNRYLLYVSEENHKQLDQDEVIQVLDPAKVSDPEWPEAIIYAYINNFEVTHEKIVNLSSIWRTGRRPGSTTVQVRLD
jgi:hypothetical protein